MQGFPKISALIMVVGFVVSVFAGRDLQQKRLDFYENDKREARWFMPWMGIDKFWSDIAWLRCINSLGSTQKKMDENMMLYYYNQFDRITDLDPDFLPVYKTGVSNIAYTDLDRALKLIEKGETYANQKDYELPYQAAHWVLSIEARPAKEPEKKREAYEKALGYLRRAIGLPGVPWYVENLFLHTQAKKEGKYGKDIPELEAWYAYYKKRLKEARQSAAAPAETDPNAPAGEAAPPPEPMVDVTSDPVLSRLRERIVDRCRSVMRDLIEKGRKVKGKALENVMADRAKIRRIFNGLELSGHYSPYSLVEYAVGDLFDPVTGDPLVPHGIDLYDYETNGRITPIKGAFNTRTGKPVASSFEELAKMLGGKKIERLAAHRPEAVRP